MFEIFPVISSIHTEHEQLYTKVNTLNVVFIQTEELRYWRENSIQLL